MNQQQAIIFEIFRDAKGSIFDENSVSLMNSIDEICHHLLLLNSRSFLFEVFDGINTLVKAPQEPYFQSLLQAFNVHDVSDLKRMAKQFHFVCFRNQSIIFLKSLVDLRALNCIAMPSQRFCNHLQKLKTPLGLRHFELMQYLNFLDHLPEGDCHKQQLVTITPDAKIKVASLSLVNEALGQILDEKTSDYFMDLSITQLSEP